MKRIGICLIAGGLASLAHAADLPTTKPAEAEKSKADCFSSLWTYLKSSVRDCPLSAGPLTLYGTLDGGFGYEQWGTRLGAYSDKANYAIQRNSGDTHWLWSPNALSTSTVGVRLSQKVGDNWEIVGAVEAGFNPYTLRLVNGPQSQADNNPFTTAFQRTAFDSARGGTWDNGQAFVGISNPTYGTLTFGRTTLLSMQALSAYDPVASVAFSQLGFTALYATFGASPTSRINTAFTYRLTYQGFRVAAQAQVGGYDQFNAATEQYQAQIGTDFNGFSFDAIAGYAKNALTFQSFGGATTPIGYNPYDIVRATAMNTGGVELRRPLRVGQIQVLRRIYLLALRQSKRHKLSLRGGHGCARSHRSSRFVTVNAYTVPRNLNTVWTGLRYSVWSNLDLAGGVYWESQNDFLAAPAVCTGSGSATSNARCAGGRYSYSFLVDYRPIPRVSLYGGLLVSTVYGGVASGFLHTENVAPTVGMRIRF